MCYFETELCCVSGGVGGCVLTFQNELLCFVLVEPYQPEGYNPEAPAMTAPSTRQPFWAAPPPPGVPPGAFPMPHGVMNVPPPPRQRDLVTVRTVAEDEEEKGGTEVQGSCAVLSSL